MTRIPEQPTDRERATGTALVADAASGHGHSHVGHSVAMFRDKFSMSSLLTVPPVVCGHELQSALGYTAPAFPGSRSIPAVFGSAVFGYGDLRSKACSAKCKITCPA